MYDELVKALRCCGMRDTENSCAQCPYFNRGDCSVAIKDDAADAIEKMIAERKQLDEIVKCRECRFYDNGTCLSPRTNYTELRRPDWYCADGKRRENAE